jgi:hypothetical protein
VRIKNEMDYDETDDEGKSAKCEIEKWEPI